VKLLELLKVVKQPSELVRFLNDYFKIILEASTKGKRGKRDGSIYNNTNYIIT